MTKKRVAAILLAPILGAVLGYLLFYALNNGWFSSRWERIEMPPGEGLELVALSQDSLWVRSAAGAIYYNEHASACESGCWQEVPEVPDRLAVETGESTVTDGACAPAWPLLDVAERLSECRRTMWVDYDFTFALRDDGSIYLWQAELYREWSVVLLFLGVCGGAVALFIPTLLVVLFLVLRDRRFNRANNHVD